MDHYKVDKYLCSKCNNSFEISYTYCPYCGKKTKKPKVAKKGNSGVFVILAVLFIGAAIWATYNHIKNQRLQEIRDKAFDAMYNQDFSEAMSYMAEYPNAQTEFSVEYDYIEAGVLLENRKYLDALIAFKDVNYVVPTSVIEPLTEKVYSLATTYYRRGEYLQARQYFEEVKSYKQSEDYLTLIKIHFSTSEDYYATLLKLIGFEDADDILLSGRYALRFLRGTWRTLDKAHYFIIHDDETLSDNFPKIAYSDVFVIEEGIVSFKNNGTKQRSSYSISLIDADCIEVRCYKDFSEYKLFRE